VERALVVDAAALAGFFPSEDREDWGRFVSEGVFLVGIGLRSGRM
jgi:hypothetical protein